MIEIKEQRTEINSPYSPQPPLLAQAPRTLLVPSACDRCSPKPPALCSSHVPTLAVALAPSSPTRPHAACLAADAHCSARALLTQMPVLVQARPAACALCCSPLLQLPRVRVHQLLISLPWLCRSGGKNEDSVRMLGLDY
jgi:hypothetical protein